MSIFKLFSTPFEGDFPALAALLSTRAMRRVLTIADRTVTLAGGSLAGAVPSDDAVGGLGASAFRPEVGALAMVCRDDEPSADASWIAGQAAILRFVSGLAPRVSVEVHGRHPLVVGGRVVEGDHLVVEGYGDELAIRAVDGGPGLSLQALRRPGVRVEWVADPGGDVIALGSGAQAVLSRGDWLFHWRQLDAGGPKCVTPEVAPDVGGAVGVLKDAVAVLEQVSTPLYLWVSLLFREYVPLRFGTTSSQTFCVWPGQVHMQHMPLLDTIAHLVHESSHSFYHLAAWHVRLVKEGAPEAFSAIKKKGRPLERILLGYHALGNVLLALALLRESPLDIEAAAMQEQLHHYGAIVAGLDEALEAHAAHLEEAGLALYLPLRARISAVAALAPYLAAPMQGAPGRGYEVYL